MTDNNKLKQIVEAALLAAGKPLSLDEIISLFPEHEQPEKKQLREIMAELEEEYQGRGIEVTEVGSGFRIQVRSEFSPWVSKLWVERPPKYSRALLETLALIAYRQPITRGEIEDIRGVSVSTNIIKTLTEREWVRVVGHRDVPGKPALYASTKEFLDYFNLKSLNELPTLAEIRDLDSINRELELQDPDKLDEEQSAQSEQTADNSEMDDDSEESEQSVHSVEDGHSEDSPQDQETERVAEADIESELIESTDNALEDEDPEVSPLLDEETIPQEEELQQSTTMSEEMISEEIPETEAEMVEASDTGVSTLKSEIDE